MKVERDFFNDLVDALDRRTAALYVGAGLSMGSNFPDWRRLLSDFAEDIGLDVAREQDLPTLAQFYLNRYSNNRGHLAQVIRSTFQRTAEVSENHRILARLPFGHVWTTNYDELLERAWELHGQRLDVKSRNADLTTSDPEAEAILYKMHGTAGHPDEIVLTKDDYELYAKSRPGFLQILGSDLITRTFLFLGLSFTDPNLSYLMGLLRASFLNAPRPHYAVLRRPPESYDAKRFEHFTADLQRYGIRTLAVDDFKDIPGVLAKLERRFAQRNVFVSGSFPENGDPADHELISEVARGVGRLVARRGLNLISGFGRVVGTGVVSGTIDELSQLPGSALARRLTIRPIREISPEGLSLDEFKRRQREDMISQAGIVLFIGGLRQGAAARGVMQEFEIAQDKQKIILPIAATGHASRQIHEQLLADPSRLPPELDLELFKRLGPETRSVEDILKAIDTCLERIQGRRL